MKKLSFRIRKRYFDMIVSGEKTVEYRRAILFWLKRIGCTEEEFTLEPGDVWTCPGVFQAVFICGKRIHRRAITEIRHIKTPDWFSSQGKADVDTPTCLAFYLGEEIKE